MATLLLVEDTYTGRREYFDPDDEYHANKCLKEWCLENKTADVFMYEVGPNIDRQIDSGFEVFTSDFKVREPGSRDISCVSCGIVREAMTEDEIDSLHLRKLVNDKKFSVETLYVTPCNFCIGYLVVTCVISPKTDVEPVAKKPKI